MSKRNTQQRRHTIISELNKHKEVTVEQLTQLFGISEVTIRKDLTILEQSGLLLRRYGGAIALPAEIVEPKAENVSERQEKIALAAAALIKDHHRIIIDSGRTTSALIPHLSGKTGLVVMTNSLNVANQIVELEHEPTLLMTGGTFDTNSESFQGQVAEEVLRSYDFDQLFIGADGIDIEKGTTTYNELIGLSRVMAEVAREVIVMVSSDKIGRKIPNTELPWQQVDILITDNDLPVAIQQQLTKQLTKVGTTLICADVMKEH